MASLLLFPGHGAQFADMGVRLYREDAEFAFHVDSVYTALADRGYIALRQRWLDGAPGSSLMAAQSALMATEYGLAMTLASRGLMPDAVLGHSAGELVAATAAGIVTLEGAVGILAGRAEHAATCPPGGMLVAARSSQDLLSLLPADVEVAAINGPRQTMLAAPTRAYAALRDVLDAHSVTHVELATELPFHHSCMADTARILEKLIASSTSFGPPAPRFYSGYLGARATAVVTSSAAFWASHLSEPVLFWDAVTAAVSDGFSDIIEIGPGTTLSTLARRASRGTTTRVQATLTTAQYSASDLTDLVHRATQFSRA